MHSLAFYAVVNTSFDFIIVYFRQINLSEAEKHRRHGTVVVHKLNLLYFLTFIGYATCSLNSSKGDWEDTEENICISKRTVHIVGTSIVYTLHQIIFMQL
jgi:hypothetical protein